MLPAAPFQVVGGNGLSNVSSADPAFFIASLIGLAGIYYLFRYGYFKNSEPSSEGGLGSLYDLWHNNLSPWFYENRELIKGISDVLGWVSLGLMLVAAALVFTGVGVPVAGLLFVIGYVLGLTSAGLDIAVSSAAIERGEAEPEDYSRLFFAALCVAPGGGAAKAPLKAFVKDLAKKYGDDVAEAVIRALGKDFLKTGVRQRAEYVAELLRLVKMEGDHAVVAARQFDKLLASGFTKEEIARFIAGKMTREERLKFISRLPQNIDEVKGFKTPDTGLGKVFVESKRAEKGVIERINKVDDWLDPAAEQLKPGQAAIDKINDNVIKMPEGGDIERIINLDITNRELESGITYKDIIRHVQNDWMKSKPHITEVVLKIKDGDVIKLISITRKDYFEVIV
jgi:hypothetical protein